MYLPIIVIDPGHGGQDPGAAAGGLVEKVLTWRWAQAVVSILSDCYQCRPLVVQPSTEFLSTGRDELVIPPARSNELEADYYLSLHINAGGGRGFESYCRCKVHPEADRIRQVIHYRILDELRVYGVVPHGDQDGLRYADYYVLTHTNAYSSLLELLYIDSPDRELLLDPLFVWRAAIAASGGLAEGMKLERRG